MASDPGPGMDGKNGSCAAMGGVPAPGEGCTLLGAKFMDGIRTLVRRELNLFMTGGCKG